MKSFTSILAIAAAFLSVSAAPLESTHNLVARCDTCNSNNVPNAIVVLGNVVADLDAHINAHVVAAVDLTAQVVLDLQAKLVVVAGAVDDCKRDMTNHVKAGVDVSATVQVFADILVKLDALLQVCGTLDVDIHAKATIWTTINLINSRCASLISVCGRIFVNLRLRLQAKVGLLVCLRGVLNVGILGL